MIPFGYEENKVTLSTLTAVYQQDADTAQEGDFQTLEISILDEGAGGFFIIKTDRWAFDDLEEFNRILLDFAAKFKEIK